MENNDIQKLSEAVKAIAINEDGKMKAACKDLFRVAEEFNVPYGMMGKICDQNNIKIMGCQLGCF